MPPQEPFGSSPEQAPLTPVGPDSNQPTQQPIVEQQQFNPAPPAYTTQPQSPYQPTSRGGQKKTGLIIGIIIGVLLVGGIVVATVMNLTGKPKSASLIAEDKTVSKDVKVGETAKLDGLEVTISAVDQKSLLGKYTKPAPGHVFMIASVRVQNNTDHNITVTPYDFQLQTSVGELYNGNDVYESSEKLASEVAPKGSSQGLVMFEVKSAQITDAKINLSTSYLPEDYTKSKIEYKASFAL